MVAFGDKSYDNDTTATKAGRRPRYRAGKSAESEKSADWCRPTSESSVNGVYPVRAGVAAPRRPQNLSPGTYYLLQDLLYRAVALTNSSGAIVEAYDCDAYAQTIIYTGPGPDGVWFTDDDVGSGVTYGANDIIFCGYPEHHIAFQEIGTGRYYPETRLYYVRNRMFLTDSGGVSVGRWIQRDPIGYQGGINLYEYVGGRAVVAVDPEGTQVIGCYPPEDPACELQHHRIGPPLPSFPMLPDTSPVCGEYPCNYTYMGANAQCFCKCAGNSPWSQYVRGCLAELYSFGASATEAHFLCYFWATEKYGAAGVPYSTLLGCYEKCAGPLPGSPPPGPQLWPWPPTAF